ncbi:unnamed protein product [marine sediment metagenome]|uniref:Uncharacterized protein n=1 Tax=marine sediment metagenome TaxID=412755 RepID=X1N4R0_9ZZZZ
MTQQEIELIDHTTGEHILMRFPDRLVRGMLPILAIFERLSQGGGYSIHFRPPLRIENESTGESFTLGRTSAIINIPGIRRPILLGAMVAAMEVNEI